MTVWTGSFYVSFFFSGSSEVVGGGLHRAILRSSISTFGLGRSGTKWPSMMVVFFVRSSFSFVVWQFLVENLESGSTNLVEENWDI